MMAIPVHMITGLLGVGKTTAIRSLLAQRSPHEQWAVIVNEFGDVGIDPALMAGERLEQDGVTIQDISGGCVCCTAEGQMRTALDLLMQRPRLDRLLIEPTGLGHPARIMDLLRSDDFVGHFDLYAVIALIHLGKLAAMDYRASGLFLDQAMLSDVLLAAKADQASAEQRQRFYTWANRLYPPKAALGEIHHGQMDLKWLHIQSAPIPDPMALVPRAEPARWRGFLGRLRAFFAPSDDTKSADGSRNPELSSGHSHVGLDRRTTGMPIGMAQPGRPLRFPSAGLGHVACGWLFDPQARFDASCLSATLAHLELPGWPPVVRIKGIFRTVPHGESVLIDRVEDQNTVCGGIAYRRDSRVEIILPAKGDQTPPWSRVEEQLLACLDRERSGRIVK
jgi:G3E family GTPase